MRHVVSFFLLAAAFFTPGCNARSYQLLEQAESRWREGNYEDAVRLNQLLHDRDPNSKYGVRALLNLGNIYYLNLRQLDKAIETYQKLISERPGSSEEFEAREKLAAIYANEIGDWGQAIYEYEKLLAWDGLDRRAEIHLQLANAYFKTEDYDRALRELRRIEEQGVVGHIADQVELKIGNIYQIRKRYEDALEAFKKVSQSPCIECRRRALFNLMETHEAMYDFDSAIETVRKLDPTPENEQRIAREVARLAEKRDQLNSAAVPVWYPHPSQ
jgi:tetratricopeptide (TPR) repeat protein